MVEDAWKTTVPVVHKPGQQHPALIFNREST